MTTATLPFTVLAPGRDITIWLRRNWDGTWSAYVGAYGMSADGLSFESTMEMLAHRLRHSGVLPATEAP